MTMWQRFSEPARRVVYLAQQAAVADGENIVTMDHFMRGLIGDPDSGPYHQLERIGVTPAHILTLVTREPAPTQPEPKDMQLSGDAKMLIDRAYDVSRTLNHNWIGPEHLLAGLLRQAEKRKDFRFRDAGLTSERVIADIKHGGGVWPPAPIQIDAPEQDLPPVESGGAATAIAMVLAIGSAAIHILHGPFASFTPYVVLNLACLAAIWFGWKARKSEFSAMALLAILVALIHECVLILIALTSR